MKFRMPSFLYLSLLCVVSTHAEPMLWVTEPFPPFSYETSGKAAGPMADIVQATCDRIKLECKIQVLPWRRALSMAEEGEAAGIFSILKSAEREKVFYVQDPIVDAAYSFFAPDNSKYTYQQIKDLDGYTVGVYGPSGTSKTLEDALQGTTTTRLITEVDNITALKKLAGNRYGDKGLVLVNRDVGLHLLKQENIGNLKVVGDLKKIQYSVGLSRKKVGEQQATQFGDALRGLIKEGKVKAILEKYGMKPAA